MLQADGRTFKGEENYALTRTEIKPAVIIFGCIFICDVLDTESILALQVRIIIVLIPSSLVQPPVEKCVCADIIIIM